MAILSPASLTTLRPNAGLYRELDVLDRLRLSLGDGFEVFHGLTWHALEEGNERHGEIDVVVLAPNGNLLLVEVKAGDVSVRNGTIYKFYGREEHDVSRQCRIQYGAVVSRLKDAGLHPFVTNCLVLPDVRLSGFAGTLAFPPERIVDAARFDQLGTVAAELLSCGKGSADADLVRQFLRNEFRVVVDLAATGEQLRRTVSQLADGLATWVPRITAPSGCIRVQATAGSGKTQLALRLMHDAVARNASVLYVCFNRSLADHMTPLAPTRAQVANFHELCIDHERRIRGDLDFTDKRIFAQAADHYIGAAPSMTSRLDLLIVDEGQDFEPEWLAALVPQLREDGMLYLMEDNDQRLYDRALFDLPEAVLIDCRDNFRSPQAICDVINALGLPGRAITARNPYRGTLPEFHVYDRPEDVVGETARAVASMVARGFALADIVVLTAHGNKRSAVQNATRIGEYVPHRFTGNYTRAGEQIWSEGNLTVESVYRFKGQGAAAIVLTEIDFAELDDAARRILFVGMTRACLAVDIVMSRDAERCLMGVLATA